MVTFTGSLVELRHVLLHVALLCKSPAAYFAVEWVFARVFHLVGCELNFLSESLPTCSACEWEYVRVSQHVLIKVA